MAEKKTSSLSKFDPTTDFDLEELTGLDDYVYFVAKQYNSEARFRRGIKIMNYHDTHSVETNAKMLSIKRSKCTSTTKDQQN